MGFEICCLKLNLVWIRFLYECFHVCDFVHFDCIVCWYLGFITFEVVDCWKEQNLIKQGVVLLYGLAIYI